MLDEQTGLKAMFNTGAGVDALQERHQLRERLAYLEGIAQRQQVAFAFQCLKER